MDHIWHIIDHILGFDYGIAYGKFNWYNCWSGFGGTVLFTAIIVFPMWWYQRSCHDHPFCLRYGKYPDASGTFKLCHKHHPDMNGQRPNSDLIKRLHEEHKARNEKTPSSV